MEAAWLHMPCMSLDAEETWMPPNYAYALHYATCNRVLPVVGGNLRLRIQTHLSFQMCHVLLDTNACVRMASWH